ncbi:hydrolase [Mycobacterium tuberculosis]|nr:hydrolase [Mycobacterium tuberculosis]CNG81772.1 hydrolase [Mycobacterium tuberculosis]
MSKTAESLTHPAYGQLRAVTDTASVLLADNPGLLTLDGTNTWVLRGPLSDELVVVDPGRTTTSTWHGLPRLAASRWY